MRIRRIALFIVLIPLIMSWSASAQAEMQTFFPGTQYALAVYYLQGEKPGPTIMVQGGIQGDEYCGYLTAQLLTRAKVHKGSLIIVPRANPPSVNIRKRTVNVDMNRRFDRDYDEFYEDHLARLVCYLLGQSQGLIHLHEGSGFITQLGWTICTAPNATGNPSSSTPQSIKTSIWRKRSIRFLHV
jgi:predicted deacylase